MPIALLMVLAAAGTVAVFVSILMTRASNRSALWNLLLAGILAFAVLGGALLIALMLTRWVFPPIR
jgi:hypothetical protein